MRWGSGDRISKKYLGNVREENSTVSNFHQKSDKKLTKLTGLANHATFHSAQKGLLKSTGPN